VGTITIQERRHCDGLDRHVPVILRDGAVYDADLDRFFLDLPLNGARSPHSLRAYGYDVMIWVRFLEDARGKSVWGAERADVAAFHRARRREDADSRISAASWNRAVATLDKLYRWAREQGLAGSSPFTHRDIWRRTQGARRVRMVDRNDAYERVAKRSDVRFISLDDYRIFRDVGLRGLSPNGAERAGARDRNGIRNALFAELLVTTGIRLEEASFLMTFEVEALSRSRSRQAWLTLPVALTKGDRGRSVLVPRRVAQQINAYIEVERTAAIGKYQTRQGWEAIEQPIYIYEPTAGATSVHLASGRQIATDALTPDERSRIVICRADGSPSRPAVLWLTEVGQPVQPNSWEVTFSRASRRCTDAGFPLRVNPHQLRHSFAVHMLALLVQRRIKQASDPSGASTAMDGYRRLIGDPLQQVQRLLGHASLATTYIYLDHIATRADTVDAAVEELLALLPKVHAQ
jgi:site-specific recombinase XerD